MTLFKPRWDDSLSSAFAKENQDDQRGSLDWVIISLILVTSLAFVARATIKYRKHQVTKAPIEELFVLGAWVFSIVQGAALLRATHFGFGLHRDTIDASEYAAAAHWLLASETLSVLSLACAKLSVVIFIMWSMQPQGHHKILSWATIGVCCLYALIGIFGSVFQCSPPQVWSMAPGQCPAQEGLIVGIGVLNIVSDILLVVLPFPIVWSVQFSRETRNQNRLIILSVFAARLVVVGLTLGFIVSFFRNHNLADPTWTMVKPALWNQGIVFISMIVTCLPAMFSFLKFMASGAMGVRIGDTQLKSVYGGSDLSRNLQGTKPKHGTFTSVRANARQSDEEDLVIDNRVKVITEVKVEAVEIAEEDIAGEKRY